MTLQDLQEHLTQLPDYAKTARVVNEAENHRGSPDLRPVFYEGQTPKLVRYARGEVIIVWGD